MQKLTTLEKVSNRVDALSANCYDMNVDVPELSFDRLNTVNIAGEPHALKTIAQRSLANRLGIPYPYLKRCPEDIQALNLNHWITMTSCYLDSMVRMCGPYLRLNIFP
jgi:hypothetical protein